MFDLSAVQKIKFQDISTSTGDISVIEKSNLPFFPKRVYILHNMDILVTRGEHAHKSLKQILIPVFGSIRIRVSKTDYVDEFHLNSPKIGLYIPPCTWRIIEILETKTVIVVLASEEYEESDYIRNYEDYQKFISND